MAETKAWQSYPFPWERRLTFKKVGINAIMNSDGMKVTHIYSIPSIHYMDVKPECEE